MWVILLAFEAVSKTKLNVHPTILTSIYAIELLLFGQLPIENKVRRASIELLNCLADLRVRKFLEDY